jgi:hypothetical protein
MTGNKIPGAAKSIIRLLPLAGVVVTALLPLQRIGQQFLMLIVLLWIQVYFISEAFLAGK